MKYLISSAGYLEGLIHEDEGDYSLIYVETEKEIEQVIVNDLTSCFEKYVHNSLKVDWEKEKVYFKFFYNWNNSEEDEPSNGIYYLMKIKKINES